MLRMSVAAILVLVMLWCLGLNFFLFLDCLLLLFRLWRLYNFRLFDFLDLLLFLSLYPIIRTFCKT